jgi:glycosyltransferase involved in cell wall biosynthesis
MPSPDAVTPAVSFVVPALNAAATLAACLEAIHAARAAGAATEVLLIDNGSTDRTPDIARQRGATVVSAPGLTVGALRNLGARLAKGDFLAFVDADCVIAPDWVEQGLASFRDPDVAAAGSPTLVRPDATWVESAWALHRHRRNSRRDVAWLPTENLMVRKTAFQQVGGFNEALRTCEDVDFCYRLGARHRIVNDPGIRSIHLGEARSLWHFIRKESWRGTGNLTGFLSHRVRFSELPSVLLPLYHVAVNTVLLGAIAYGLVSRAWQPALVAGAGLLLPPSVLAVDTGVRTGRLRRLPQLMVLYLAYACARSLGMAADLPSLSRHTQGEMHLTNASDAAAHSGRMKAR